MEEKLFVDPTPRSINHLEKVFNSVGNKKTKDYVDGGNQKIESYDLENIQTEQLIIKNYALFNEDGITVKFFHQKTQNT